MTSVTALHIATDRSFELPLETVTQPLAILATRGSGKSYTAAVIAEEFSLARMPFVVIDPLGVFWGLRSTADGKKPAFRIAIAGGEFGDVPLKAKHGRAMAQWVVDERLPIVLDLSEMRREEQTAFLLAFTSELYHRNREPLHIIVDECDLYCNQTPSGKDERKLLGQFEDLVRRGRIRGIGITLISQRPAVVNKNVLTQVSTMLTMRMGGPQDRDAIHNWIKFHGEKHEQVRVLESLSSLPIGTGWLWSPGWLGIMKKVHIRRRHTWDSSSTPKPGEPRALPESRSKPNLGGLVQLLGVKSAEYQAQVRELRASMPKLSDEIVADLDELVHLRCEDAHSSEITPGWAYLAELIAWYKKIPQSTRTESDADE